MPKFQFQELVDGARHISARLGSAADVAGRVSDAEVGKFFKLAGESRYDLCAVGDQIEGRLAAYEPATMDGFSFGSIQIEGRFYVTFDGLQATPGTGTLAIGDYVVCGTPAAKGTKLTAPAKVCKAAAAGSSLNFKWRVVSLGAAGTGAVGTTGLIELVC